MTLVCAITDVYLETSTTYTMLFISTIQLSASYAKQLIGSNSTYPVLHTMSPPQRSQVTADSRLH